MTIMEVLFWSSVAVLFWVFIGYPVFMIILSRILGRSDTAKPELPVLPGISLLICAYNEEKVIGEKIKNSLSLDYPADKLNIIVVSDGSSDRTNEIAASFTDSRLQFITYPDRGGKAKALNTGISYLKGEIVVFTDANVMFEPEALRKLVAYFADPEIGGVVGNVILRSADGSIAGEGVYSRYEKAVHTAEVQIATMITVDGAMYALRREFVAPIPSDSITDDWYMASGALAAGKKIAWGPDAIGYEQAAESVAGEFRRKVRMAAGGYQTTFRRAVVFLNPVGHPVIFFMFLSHKLLRWLAMVFMAALAVSSAGLAGGSTFYAMALAAQVAFYLLALLGFLLRGKSDALPIYLPYYFTAVNWGALLGLWRYLAGRQSAAWTRSRN
jgi:cellulose synthase/poly-beta-1,6-N-acetylglucosamine synthase-like glycosyltransferase